MCLWGLAGRAPEAFLLILALPGGTHSVRKVGMCGALEPHVACWQGPEAGGKKPRWEGRSGLPPQQTLLRGWAGLTQLPHAHGGGTLPTSE